MFKAIIFDMDGVISDTQKLHAQIESELLGRYGIEKSPEEITHKYAGIRTQEFFDELLKTQSKQYSLNELMAEKMQRMTERALLSVDEIPGAVKLIKGLYADGYKLAVASSSDIKYVNTILKNLEIADFFDAVIAGDMVAKGKPDPECFLLAANKLNVDPDDCLVIEDGVSGMQAAKNAGMECVGLVIDKTKEYPTDNLVTSLSEISMNYLESY